MKFKQTIKLTSLGVMTAMLIGQSMATKPLDLTAPNENDFIMNEIRAVSGNVLFFEDFQTQDNPQAPLLPAGWVVVDVDGNTVNSSVSIFTEAWIAFNAGDNNFAAASTSWYTPAGSSDDWLITPAININSGSLLRWKGLAPDASYPDGYEVYISDTTQDVAGCSANAPVLTVAAELQVFTEREVNLGVAGYNNTTVYVCFRNNSFDKYILEIDDVTVLDVLSDDVAIDSVTVPEYTQYPVFLNTYNIPLGVAITNNGYNSQNNINAVANINVDLVFDGFAQAVEPGPLALGESVLIDIGTYPVSELGMYSIFYDVALDGVSDAFPDDNMFDVLEAIEVTADVMSRDIGPVIVGIGTNSNEEANLGNMFEFTEAVTVGSVLFRHNNSACDIGGTEACGLDGESIFVDVFSIDALSGLPDALLATSEAYVVPASPGGYDNLEVEMNFTDELNLAAGEYVFAVRQPERTVSTFANTNLSLGLTEERFTPGTVWGRVTSGGVVGSWNLLENLGFPYTLQVKVKLINGDVIFKNGFE